MVGRTVLHYTILRELGGGGMGRVYLARDERTHRSVALKFLAPALHERLDADARLLREARAAARLSHPGIVTLFGVEETDGEMFLVQEYVPGETLSERLSRGPLDAGAVHRLARELTDALAHAHAEGVVHRDLKPENVLLTGTGHVKVADFGLARIVDTRTALTAPGTLLGTLPYMAPERVTGEPGDARSDLFALGAILYEALAGRRAFGGSTEAEILHRIVNEDPPPVAGIAPSLDPLHALALRLLAKDAAARPSSATVVQGLLDEMPREPAPNARSEARTLTAASSVLAPSRGRTRDGRRARVVRIGLGLAVVVLALAVLWIVRGRLIGEAQAEGSIAVLSFENVPDPVDRDKLGTIAGNLLVNSLAQASGLTVLGTQTVLDAVRQLGHRGHALEHADALAVARRVEARHLVTGSILQSSPTLVLTYEVVDVRTGKVMMADRVEGQPGQTIFEVVDALGSRLAVRLSRTSGARLEPVAARTSRDLNAQRSYAEGLEAMSDGDLDAAERAFTAAIERDPSFAQAHFELAITQWWAVEPANAKTSVAAARVFAARLGPAEREALDGVEALIGRRWDEARTVFRPLVRRYPRDPLALYGLVEATFHGGRPAEAVEAGRRLVAIDPHYPFAAQHLADALFLLGRANESEAVLSRAIATSPRNGFLAATLTQMMADRGDGRGALRILRSPSMPIAPGSAAPFLGIELAVALDSIDAARAIAARDPRSVPSTEIDPSVSYLVAMREGRFRDAVRLADRCWAVFRSADLSNRPGPIGRGFEAAIRTGDVARAEAWIDSIMLRAERLDLPLNAEILRGAVRVEALLGAGDRAEAAREAAVLARVGAGATPQDRGTIVWAQALLAEAEGRPGEALAQLGGTSPTGGPWETNGRRRMARARLLQKLGRPREALAALDTLSSAPVANPVETSILGFERARALEALGRKPEALDAYRRFLVQWRRADADQPELRQARAAVARLSRRV